MDLNHPMQSSTLPCAFSFLIGNAKAKLTLNTFLSQGKIPQTLLFTGPKGVGKTAFAYAFAQHITKSSSIHHPDIHIVCPSVETDQYSVASLREMIGKTFFAPLKSPYKVFVMSDIEKMAAVSMNTLLKTLEEPPLDTIFVLTTFDASKVLPTILSRCAKIHFYPIEEDEMISFLIQTHELTEKSAARIASLAEGSFVKMLEKMRHQDQITLLEKGLKAVSYLEIEQCLSDKNLSFDSLSFNEQETILEDILSWIHQNDPDFIPLATKQIGDIKYQLLHHVKLKTALEYFLINYRLLRR